MGFEQRGKALSETKIKMLLRQYRMMGAKVTWIELGRRCGVHASTAKRYVETYLNSLK